MSIPPRPEPVLSPASVHLREALGARQPRRLVRVGGVALAVHDSDPSGHKPALVCLHAIGHGGSDFSAVEDAFAERWRIVTVDWPGHGYSEPDREPASSRRYAALLAELVPALGLDRFVIIGNSIGGGAAIIYAAAQQAQVRGLVLANPAGLDPGGLLASLFIGWLIRSFERGVRREPRFARWFRSYYDRVLPAAPAWPQRAKIVAAGYEAAPILVQAWKSFRVADNDLRRLIPALTMPVWFAWARRDGLVRWSRNKRAVRSFSNATVEQFAAGHTPFLEAPEAFNRSLARFLATLS